MEGYQQQQQQGYDQGYGQQQQGYYQDDQQGFQQQGGQQRQPAGKTTGQYAIKVEE